MATSRDFCPEWTPSQPYASRSPGCFDMWLTFNEAGRPEMPKQITTPESVPTRCPSLIYSPQGQIPVVGELIFEGLVSKDRGVRRRDQNRASQRRYRDRQRRRLDELQQEIDDLKALCMQLEKENKTLTMDYQERWNRLLMDLKNELENPEAPSPQQESIGWMLKHAYGSEEANNAQFSVYPLGSTETTGGPST
ncbi:hypothetical protein M409DRAFT_19353 [Zasmidium cellare ATCC 36951]|uniref:BZIP domain-containing protein n=1 Tax=Zasmidium cellare ATCC 36951 TaxID=1080233 RepID=A0A6A6CUZ5_ZASCE|nr:uncharacterized protein M409DRAFT_19353 [Zasmidium cellare ATCC 36951]KAF2170533.1 hypothetical protein M409DRAFT_19353 [Zasmidium cellare ATCC 36951]